MEERELPAGWELAQIGDLCELKNGRAFKAQDWREEGLPIVRIQNLNKPNAPYNYFQGEVEERFRLRGGELLFAWSGTPGTSFGAHVWQGADAVLNQHIFRVDFDRHLIDVDFFRYAINQKLDDLIDTAHGGVGLRHVTKGKFEKTEVCLPPQAEQRRIAAKLDTTLAAVDACRQRLDGVEALIKRFRQAVLEAATSGALTREWREGSAEPEWDTKAMGECGAVTGGITKNSSRTGLPLQKPYLRVANVYHNRLELDDLAVIGVTESEYAKTVLRVGDLLIVEGNGSLQQVGRVAIWEEAGLDCVHQNHLIRWRSSGARPKWALYWLMSPVGRDLLEQRAKSTTGLHTLSVSKISNLPIPVPSLSEQDEIINRVESLFSLADELEAKLTAARRIVQRLTPALLAKAFRGELVPQDPNDEPASVLLERIRAARQAEAAAGKPSRRGRKKAAANPAQSLFDAAPVPPDLLSTLLRECGALSDKALLAASELDPARFQTQLELEQQAGGIRQLWEQGEALWEAVG